MPLDFCDAKILCSEGVDVSYYSFVSQLEKGVVNDESVWGGGVEGSKISVSWLVTIEVGVGEGSGVERGSINCSVLCPPSL